MAFRGGGIPLWGYCRNVLDAFQGGLLLLQPSFAVNHAKAFR